MTKENVICVWHKILKQFHILFLSYSVLFYFSYYFHYHAAFPSSLPTCNKNIFCREHIFIICVTVTVRYNRDVTNDGISMCFHFIPFSMCHIPLLHLLYSNFQLILLSVYIINIRYRILLYGK